MPRYKFDQIATNSTEKKKPVESDRLTYLGLEHLDSGSLKVTRFGSEVAPVGEKLVMRKGDVLFGKRRAYQKKVAIAPFDGIFSAHGMVLRPKANVIDPDFFPLFISSDYFLDSAIKISVGSLSPTINWRDLRELEFELPDLASQKKLAAILWSINDTIDSYKQLISATDDLVKSQFIEMFGNPIKNDRGWRTLKMSDVAPSTPYQGEIKPKDGKVWLLNLDMVEPNTGKIIEKLLVDPKDIGNSTLMFSPKNVLYSKLRPYLNKVVVPDDYGYATTEMVPLLPSNKNLDPGFFSALLRGDEFLNYIETQATGTKMPRVQMNIFWNIEVILPPLELQKQFAAFVRQSDKSKFAA